MNNEILKNLTFQGFEGMMGKEKIQDEARKTVEVMIQDEAKKIVEEKITEVICEYDCCLDLQAIMQLNKLGDALYKGAITYCDYSFIDSANQVHYMGAMMYDIWLDILDANINKVKSDILNVLAKGYREITVKVNAEKLSFRVDGIK